MKQTSTIVIAASSSGDNELVAATAGVVVRVLSYVLSAAGAVSARFKSGASTNLTGAMSMITGVPNGAAAPPRFPNDACLLQTAAGEALVLNLSGATGVNGFAVIEKVSQTP